MKYTEGLVDVVVPRVQEAILGIVPTCPLTGEPAVGDEQICLEMRKMKDGKLFKESDHIGTASNLWILCTVRLFSRRGVEKNDNKYCACPF